jgi:hypothetical protein
MENAAAIFYRETGSLADSQSASLLIKRSSACCPEMARTCGSAIW